MIRFIPQGESQFKVEQSYGAASDDWGFAGQLHRWPDGRVDYMCANQFTIEEMEAITAKMKELETK